MPQSVEAIHCIRVTSIQDNMPHIKSPKQEKRAITIQDVQVGQLSNIRRKWSTKIPRRKIPENKSKCNVYQQTHYKYN